MAKTSVDKWVFFKWGKEKEHLIEEEPEALAGLQKTLWCEDPGWELFINEAGKEVRSENMEGHVTVNGLISTHEELRRVTT